MHALRYARNALVEGHAARLLAGGAEELFPQSAWAWHHGDALTKGTALAEGCAMFALDAPAIDGAQRGGTRVLGRLLACDIGFADPAKGLSAVSARLAGCVRTALARSGIAPGEVGIAAPGAAGRRGWAAVEERALRQVFSGGSVPRRLRVHQVLGETHAAGTALQLAAVLAGWRYPAGRTGTDSGAERVAVLTAVGSAGSVGCLVVAHPDFH
jgi:3-oxoacyl-[acyl-carrier-protein] synthase II